MVNTGLVAAAGAVGVELALPPEHPVTEPAVARKAASRVSLRSPVIQAT
jgi:hypothetical protein